MSQQGSQMTIFDSGVKCVHCQKDPGTKDMGHWKGFYDADTRQKVCWGCRSLHYARKALTSFKGLYSEMPVIIANDGNDFPFKNKK